MLKGKTVLLCVTGGIAAYKIASLASMLVKAGADVRVIMTEHATNFITPITFETLTGHKCIVDTFDRNFEFKVAHISLAQQADVILVAPATANVIAKLANGLADDMLTTTILASEAPTLVSPAMNTHMFLKQVTQDNLDKLRHYGMEVIDPASGYLACGDTGAGKMPEPALLMQYILKAVLRKKDMAGKRVLITAGPTQEAVDPVRYLTNHSTGKMGYALAKEASYRGAKVTLISGKVALEAPPFVDFVSITSAKELYDEVTTRAPEQDIIIMAAAVADYRPKHVADQKIKKSDDEAVMELERTDDILMSLGQVKKTGQFLCGFSMETESMEANSRKKLEKKNLDMIVANNLKEPGAGFATDTNVVTIITKEESKKLSIRSKDEVASEILTQILERS